MVNIGGRSKGCSTCRRRRVKCDENRPVCLRCQRGGLECDGPKDLAFVDATIVASRRKIEQRSHALPTASNAPEAEGSADIQTMHPSAPLGNPQENYIMFARSRLGPIDLALRELQSSDITRIETARTADCRTAHLRTVLSFATIFFGKEHGQPGITQQGYLSHGATLQQLNRALSEPSCYKFDEIIVSVTTLAIQETLIPSGPMYFLNHMLGLERLLALRDPHLYCSPTTINLYRCLRYMLLFNSLGAGRSSILARPEWKEVLIRSCVSSEALEEQQLYDVLADCSVLAFERNELLTKKEAKEEGLEGRFDNIRHRTQALCVQLQAWREQWNANPVNAYAEVPTSLLSSQLHQESRDDVVYAPPTDLVFSNISSALMLMLYNVALINLLKILISLPLGSPHETSRDESMAVVHSAVLEIYRSMPYASTVELQKECHTAPVFHWATQTAQTVLQDDDSAKAKWLKSLLNWKTVKPSAEAIEVI